jgi:hypothetical protein
MTIHKTLLAGGLLLASTSIALAAAHNPTLVLKTGGATNGQKGEIVVWGIPGEDAGGTPLLLTGAQIIVTFDAGKTTVANSGAEFVPGPGWTRNDSNVDNNQVLIAMSNTDGQAAPGPIVTIKVSQNADSASSLTVATGTNVADDQFGQYDVPAMTASFLPGPFRQLGAAISGAPSVGPAGNIAVVAGNSLHLLSAADLTDVQGFAPAGLSAGINGRPAFGLLDGTAVVAVGTKDGNVSIWNAATGAQVGSTVDAGDSATTPAIDSASNTVYVASISGGAATLTSVKGGVATPSTSTIAGAAVVYSPAVYGGNVVLASDKGINVGRADGTPQSSVTTAASVAPILNGAGRGLIVAGGNVWGINATTGALSATSVPAPAGLSDLWFEGGTFYGGAADGKIYKFTVGTDGTPAAAGSDAGLPAAIATQPLVIGGKTYAVDVNGNLLGTNADGANIGGPGTGALAATGRGASDSIIVSETGGGIGALSL